MKKLLFCLSCLLCMQWAFAQPVRQPAPATGFIKALNDLLQAAPKVDWDGNNPTAIDSAFHLSGDSLTYTLAYRTGKGNFRIRFVAPLQCIEKLEHDYYLILLFSSNQVNIYKQSAPGASWTLEEQSAMMHIGTVEDVSATIKQLCAKAEQAFARWKGQ